MEIMQTFAIALINGSNLLQIPPYNTTPSALHKRTRLIMKQLQRSVERPKIKR